MTGKVKFGIICLVSVLISYIGFFYYSTNIFPIIPSSYISLTIGLTIFIVSLNIINFFYLSRGLNIFIQVISYLYVALLLVILGGMLWMNHHLDKVASVDIPKSQMHIIVRKDSAINDIRDLDGKTLEYQTASNKKETEEVLESIKKENMKNPIKSKEASSYNSIISDLLSGKTEAVLIDGSATDMIKNSFKYFDKEIKIIKSYDKTVAKAKVKETQYNNEPFTLFISGIDRKGNPMQEALSDVDLLLFVYPNQKKVKMISMPRDTYVPNPAVNNGLDKLTHTGVYGIENTVKTVENLFDIKIDYYVRVGFDAIPDILDIIGDIEVDVEIDFCEQNSNRSFAEKDLICLKKGIQKLNGEQALAYARHRKTAGYNDQGRNRAQQKIIEAIANKALSVTQVTNLPKMINTLSDSIATNMPKSDILNFARAQLEEVSSKGNSWTFETLTTIKGHSEMLPTASMGQDLPLYVWIPKRESLKIIHDEYIKMCSNSAKNECADIQEEYQPPINMMLE